MQFWRAGQPVSRAAGLEALEFLRALAPAPCIRHHATEDPIGISDRMAGSDEILYVPLMFGYSSYARREFRRRTLRFGNAPRGSSGAIAVGSRRGWDGFVDAIRASREVAAALAQRDRLVRGAVRPLRSARAASPVTAQPGIRPRSMRSYGEFFTRHARNHRARVHPSARSQGIASFSPRPAS